MRILGFFLFFYVQRYENLVKNCEVGMISTAHLGHGNSMAHPGQNKVIPDSPTPKRWCWGVYFIPEFRGQWGLLGLGRLGVVG